LAEVQVAVVVTSVVDPSGFFAVAVNCCVAPMAKLAGSGVTEIVTAVTFRIALALIPPNETVTVAEPAATAVATPEAVMVATFPLASVQVAHVVTSAVDPSL
jgi:hypothetical protein